MKGGQLKSIPMMFVTLVMIGYVLISCAPSARVPINRPAEINLMGIKQIAIGDIQGNAGRALSESISEKLFESDHFKIVDRANLKKVLSEQSLGASGAVDEDTAVKMGKLLGASALITGRSDLKVNNSRSVSKTYYTKKKQPYRYYRSKTKVNQNTSLKVIDLTTGQVVAVKTFSKSATRDQSDKNGYPPYPDQSILFGKTNSATVTKFAKMIAPYTEYVKVSFENDKTPEGKAGIQFAQAGEWRETLEQFKSAADKNPTNFKSWYNLGIAYEYNYMYDEAISAFKQSCNLKPSSKSIKEITNVKKLRAGQKKLEMQKSEVQN